MLSTVEAFLDLFGEILGRCLPEAERSRLSLEWICVPTNESTSRASVDRNFPAAVLNYALTKAYAENHHKILGYLQTPALIIGEHFMAALRLDIELTEAQKETMAAIPPKAWFTQVIYRNAQSAVHPDRQLAENNEMKQVMVSDWITRSVPGKRVLDLFSANGIFSFVAALAGAREVVGVEYSEDRVQCAEFVASTLRSNCTVVFKHGDIYKILDYFDEPFDVVLCLGGLYHIADPALLLRQIGRLTTERLILQTAQVLRVPGNWAKFRVRRQDRTQEGLTSIRGGYGTWHYSRRCLRELLLHGGFRVVEERQFSWLKHRRFPWYLACCERL